LVAAGRGFPRHASRWKLAALYFLALLNEFRWTILLLVAAIIFAALLYVITPQEQLAGENHPSSPRFTAAGWHCWRSRFIRRRRRGI
jgi:hypothetical protein